MSGAATRRRMSTEEVAEYLGYSVAHVYRLVGQRIIPYCKPTGGHLSFFADEIEKWVAQGRKKTMEEMKAEADETLARMGKK
jgi:prophage regulatory protein